AKEKIEDELIDDVVPEPAKRRKAGTTRKPVKPANEKKPVKTEASQPLKAGRPTDVAKWQEADFLSARRALDPALIDGVAHLVEEKPQAEDTAKILATLITQEAESEKDGPIETVLVDDALPEGVAATHDAFVWVGEPTYPVYSGEKSFKRVVKEFDRDSPFHTCRFEKLPEPIAVGPRDSLFVYVHIDADDPPDALMLGFKTDRWHGAFWGPEDRIDFGAIRKSMGDVPQAGNWLRLEVPAKGVELDDMAIQGLAFLQFGGTVYWDKAGVKRHQSDQLVAPIIAALGRNKSATAKATLFELIEGKLPTLLDESESAERAWNAIESGMGEGADVDEATRALLLEVVSEPTKYRSEDAEKFTADDLFDRALPRLKKAMTPELRMKLADKLADSNLPADQFRKLTDMLAEPEADNFAAQIKLYQSTAVEPDAMRKFAENFANMSAAALAHSLGLEGEDLPKKDTAIAAAKELWTPEFLRSVRERFIESEDAGVEPKSARFAMTMPLAENRETLRKFYEAAGKTSGPSGLEDAGVFGDELIDPGMLPIFKRIWHNDSSARRKATYRGDDDLPLGAQWSEAGRRLVESMSDRFFDNGEEGMFEGKSPISLHRSANVTRSFSSTWIGTGDDDLGELAGLGVGTTIIRYARTEDELDEKLASRVHTFYSRQISRALTHKIDESTTWIDGLTRGSGGRLRSVDVLIRVDRPEKEVDEFEPLEFGGGVGGGGIDDAVGGPVDGDRERALQWAQLQREYHRYREKIADSNQDRLEYMAKLQRATTLEERERRQRQILEEEEDIRRYQRKFAEVEHDIRVFRQEHGPRKEPRPRAAPAPRITPGKVNVRIDILIVEIDPPGSG
ncbi:MAG: OmpH family outer membrane protein, partial [Pirellulales bacterium]|nr:OmpH family outer membrane protein [Pirellulales bacterium]